MCIRDRYKSLEVSDISIGGVGTVIFSKNPIAAGHFAKLEIQLPTTNSNNRIVARGQIVHCSPKAQNRMAYLLGIKFVELSDNDQRKIIEYIAGLQEKAESVSCACFEYKADDKNDNKSDQEESAPNTPEEVA
jgi:c-di-GMP-binding flagellar brake protein YcgR